MKWSFVPRRTSLAFYHGLFLLALHVSWGTASEARTEQTALSFLLFPLLCFPFLLFSSATLQLLSLSVSHSSSAVLLFFLPCILPHSCICTPLLLFFLTRILFLLFFLPTSRVPALRSQIFFDANYHCLYIMDSSSSL